MMQANDFFATLAVRMPIDFQFFHFRFSQAISGCEFSGQAKRKFVNKNGVSKQEWGQF
jgi:hypothetical protein